MDCSKCCLSIHHTSRWTLVMCLKHMIRQIVKQLAMANHPHTWWHNITTVTTLRVIPSLETTGLLGLLSTKQLLSPHWVHHCPPNDFCVPLHLSRFDCFGVSMKCPASAIQIQILEFPCPCFDHMNMINEYRISNVSNLIFCILISEHLKI